MNSFRIIDNAAGESCGGALFNVSAESGALAARKYLGNAAVVTLGCAKNQVDSEVMLGTLRKHGFQVVNDVEQAEVVVVNTCGFLESSVKESIDCILDVAELKARGRLRKLIVAGCLVQRYNGELQTTLPEVDAFIGIDDLLKVGDVAADSGAAQALLEASRPYFLYDESMPRQLSTRPHFAYVKISEGCDRPCTFCIIPKIRGAMRSRTVDSVLAEVRGLAQAGVKEVNLVAQDLTAYGKDRKDAEDLTALLETLDRAGGVPWVRLLYTYPLGIDEMLLKAVERLGSVCEYVDLPLQHASENVLRGMQRPLGKFSPRKLVEFIRKTAPGIKLRTTFIVGFPGETESDIADLEAFVGEGHFSSVGVFTYSREKGTPSYDLAGHLSQSEKDARRDLVMKRQQAVNGAALQGHVGSVFDVLIDGPHEESDLLLSGRTRFQAPEVDGIVIINDLSDDGEEPRAGDIRKVEITDTAGYDLIGRLI